MLERPSGAQLQTATPAVVDDPVQADPSGIDGDEALVVRSRNGDRASFEELIRRTGRLVFSQIMLKVGDTHLAEDLTQETFLNAYRAIATMHEPKGFRAWLLKIAHSVVIDHARRSNRKKRAGGRSSVEGLDVADSGPGPAEQTEMNEAREQAIDLLHALPEDYRRPLMLRYLANADYETIGKQLGISNGSLRGLLNRGMALLRAEFEKRRR